MLFWLLLFSGVEKWVRLRHDINTALPGTGPVLARDSEECYLSSYSLDTRQLTTNVYGIYMFGEPPLPNKGRVLLAKNWRKEGRKEGKKEGRKEGRKERKEGRKEGGKKGRKEGRGREGGRERKGKSKGKRRKGKGKKGGREERREKERGREEKRKINTNSWVLYSFQSYFMNTHSFNLCKSLWGEQKYF